MAQKTKEILKTYFETGDKPTQAQFEDLIDTLATESEFAGGTSGQVLKKLSDNDNDYGWVTPISSPFQFGDNGAIKSSVGGCKATGVLSFAVGWKVEASGDKSSAFGQETKAEKAGAASFGNKSVASAPNAFATGTETKAANNNSSTFGLGTEANNKCEQAVGKYNISHIDSAGTTRFSVGVGSSSTQRKNAIEITEDGKIYIQGIGGYTGQNNPTESGVKSLQEVLTEMLSN